MSRGGNIALGASAVTVGLVYWFGVRPWWQKRQAQNALTSDQKTTITAGKGKVLKNLTGKPIASMNLATLVVDLYNRLHPGWYKPTDQDSVIRVFKTIPFGYVKQIEQMYLDKYGENLKSVIADKLSDANFIKLKYWFE